MTHWQRLWSGQRLHIKQPLLPLIVTALWLPSLGSVCITYGSGGDTFQRIHLGNPSAVLSLLSLGSVCITCGSGGDTFQSSHLGNPSAVLYCPKEQSCLVQTCFSY